MIVFDVSNIQSFNDVSRWISHINQSSPTSKKCLIANKTDLECQLHIALME